VKNKLLGQFDLSDISAAPRGTPQIEVSFDIDANGILNVSAQDKATGKKHSIVVKASSGLSESEIEQMIKDAQVHAAEDKKFQELVQARNQADHMIHTVEHSLSDIGDKISSEQKDQILSLVATLKESIKGESQERIEKDTQVLSDAYQALASQFGSGSQDQTASAGQKQSESDNVMDAEFEEKS